MSDPTPKDVHAFLRARDILNGISIPTDSLYAWVNRDTYLALGGTEEGWDRLAKEQEDTP